MNKIANLLKQQRSELFSETATFMNTTNSIVEKDFWVVWTLDKIFSDDKLNKILMFKGGTSLSWKILDWRLVSKENPLNEQESKNKQVKFNEQINENAKEYIQNELLPIISQILWPLCTCIIAEDGFSINVRYPNAFDDNYLRPEILLEI